MTNRPISAKPFELEKKELIKARMAVVLVVLSAMLSSPVAARKSVDFGELYSTGQKQASFLACVSQFPRGKPFNVSQTMPSMRPIPLCSDAFAVLYSPVSKTPLVVVEKLSSARLTDAKDEERTDQFFADPRLAKKDRAELSDYSKQDPAVDRGHLSPAADAPTARAMAQSFSLSNMMPQDPNNNRKAWAGIEKATRKYAMRSAGNLFVYTGPIFDPGYTTVGRNKVWKPTRIYKLVYDEASGRAWAYIVPNAETRVQRPIDYETFVKLTGLDFLHGLPVTGTVGR